MGFCGWVTLGGEVLFEEDLLDLGRFNIDLLLGGSSGGLLGLLTSDPPILALEEFGMFGLLAF